MCYKMKRIHRTIMKSIQSFESHGISFPPCTITILNPIKLFPLLPSSRSLALSLTLSVFLITWVIVFLCCLLELPKVQMRAHTNFSSHGRCRSWTCYNIFKDTARINNWIGNSIKLKVLLKSLLDWCRKLIKINCSCWLLTKTHFLISKVPYHENTTTDP